MKIYSKERTIGYHLIGCNGYWLLQAILAVVNVHIDGVVLVICHGLQICQK